jgi:hypothetical protein
VGGRVWMDLFLRSPACRGFTNGDELEVWLDTYFLYGTGRGLPTRGLATSSSYWEHVRFEKKVDSRGR